MGAVDPGSSDRDRSALARSDRRPSGSWDTYQRRSSARPPRGSRPPGGSGPEPLAVFRQEHPVLVVAPSAADLQVALAVSLFEEPGAPNQVDRTEVGWLDARLDPVQSQIRERVVQDQLKALPHVTSTGERNERVVAEVRASGMTVEDLPQPEIAGDLAVARPKHQQGLAGRRAA